MKTLFTILIALILTVNLNAQLVIDNSQPAAQIIEDIFLSNGIFVANVTFSGMPDQIGTFAAANSNVGLNNGIIMASGDVNGAIGPNNTGSFTLGGGNFGIGEPDLELANPGYYFNDASVVEFDFIATGDSLDFQFVFGSEEYPEFVGSTFNDAFGFFISGLGIDGDYTNNAVNIALVPGTTTPVAINNLNNGTDGLTGPCLNCEYYIYNGEGYSEPYFSDSTIIQCDGFTTILHASIGALVVGETYHIKLAIADAGDSAFDSYVFLGGESFVQFCNEEVDFMPDVCMLSHLDAQFEYTGDCGTISINNYSDINIDYTACHFEMGDGGTVDACNTNLSYEYAQPGTYQVNLVYEVNEFHAQFAVGEVVISTTAPEQPTIAQDLTTLTATNWNNAWEIQWYYEGNPIPGGITESIIAQLDGTYSVAYTNSCGTISATLDVQINAVTELGKQGVVVFPNPSSGQFMVATKYDHTVVVVYDHTGQLVFEKECNGLLSINLELAAGIYTMEVLTENGTEVLYREKVLIH